MAIDSPPHFKNWVLYSPITPTAPGDAEAWGVPIAVCELDRVARGPHEGGFFLPEADFEGWRFGLLQEVLHMGGMQAFVQSPTGVEATLVWDRHATVLEQLKVPSAPGYLGAFRILLDPPLDSRENVAAGFRAVLPLLKQHFGERSVP